MRKERRASGVTLSLCVTTLTACIFLSRIAVGQAPVTDTGPRFLLASNSSRGESMLDVSRTPILKRRISLELRAASLKDALAEISREAGIPLFYSDDMLPGASRVSLRADNITVAAALTDVLADADVDVVFNQNGKAALRKRPPQQQKGSISGVVNDSASGQVLAAARVRVEGTKFAATTDDVGRYSIGGLDPGDHLLTVRRLGYTVQSRRVTVAADQDTRADFSLGEIPATLEQVVTTVTGDQRRMEIGNTIGTINADSVVRDAPITSLSDLINARVPGVQVVLTGGFTGTSPRIVMRGPNSISLNTDPLLVVDGVRVENSSASSGGFGQTAGRFNDLNPEEIESIELVKGPAAATLYGTDAANGVIVVKTKRGRPGQPRWNLYAEMGRVTQPANFPDNYYSWGHNAVTGAVQQCTLLQTAAATCAIDSLTRWNPLRNALTSPLANGARQQNGLQVSGGVSQFTYFVGAELEQETGVLRMPSSEVARVSEERGGAALPDEQLRPNALRRLSLRANLGITLGSSADVSLSSGLVSGTSRIPSAGGIFQGGLWGRGYRDALDGWGFFTARPGEAFAVRNSEDVTHYNTALTSNWRPLSWLSTRGTVGSDFSSTFLDGLQRRGEGPLGAARNGQRLNTRTDVALYTGDAGASAQFALTPSISSRTSAGVQYNRRLFRATSVNGTNLSPGSETVTGAAIVTGSEQNIESVVAGGYLEQTFGHNDRVFLTGALRADGGSAFGQNFHTALYPKASVSWLLSDRGTGTLTSLRLRSAYGVSGVQPAPTASIALVSLAPALIEGVTTTGAQVSAIGNPDLKPERQAELEAGLDAELWGGRVKFEGTFYNRISRDALINRPLGSDLGITSRQENIGSVSNRGVEGMLSLDVIESSTTTWNVSFNGSANRNRVEKLGIPNIGVPNSRTQAGYPISSRFARPILGFNDANGNGIIELSEVRVGDSLVYIGPGFPPRQLTTSSALGLFGGKLRVATQFDYRGGHKTVDFMRLNRCSATFSNCAEVNVPGSSLADQARAVAVNSASLGNTQYGFIEDGSFVRWRELSVTYQLPAEFGRVLHSRTSSITLTGRNLRLFTRYSGLDPEINSSPGFGTVPTYSDNPTAPPSRYWLFRLNLGF